MKKFRIFHLNTERTWRGGERQTFWLAEELARRGHANWVGCRPDAPLEKRCQQAGLSVVPLRPWMEMDLWTAARLKQFLQKERIEILHAHTAHAVGLGALALTRAQKFVATRRVDFPLKKNILSRWKHSQLDAFAAVAGPLREVLIQGGFPSEKTHVIHSGIRADLYPSRSQRSEFRRARGYGENEILIVHAGALVGHKDQKTLLRAMSRLLQKIPSARLLILGEGPLRVELTTFIQKAGLSPHVELLGHRADVLEYMAMADLFVVSSSEEGICGVLLDAMALGIPTAATRAGGIVDVYGNPSVPELTSPRDDAALAQNMIWVLTDPTEAQRRVAFGEKRAPLFSVQNMADRYEALYDSLLTGPNV